MSRYVLLPGAGGTAWYWSRVVPLLQQAGHDAVAVDLPSDDETSGLPEYAELAVQAAGGSDEVVLVAQSMGGFTAPLVWQRVPIRALVLVNAMIPEPGETAGNWWDNVGAQDARERAADDGGYTRELDPAVYFLHDLPSALSQEGAQYERPEADIAFSQPCEFTSWPDVPIHVLSGADDRLFPVELQEKISRDRLGITPDVLSGGHLIALANPTGVADYLIAAAG